MANTKKPIIGPATKAKVTSVVRKVQNSKAAGAVKKAGAAIKQEARVVGRAVTGYSAKKEKAEKAKESSSPASAFQVPKSAIFGNGPIKSQSQLRDERKEARHERKIFNKMARSADRSKRGSERAFTLSPGSERFQSGKEGLTWNGVTLPEKKREAIRTISDNAKTKLEGRARRVWAKGQYEIVKNTPTTDAEKKKRDSKLQKNAIIGNTSIGAGSKSGPSTADMQKVCPRNATNGGKKGTCAPKMKKK
jgi:hypothetical protein